MGYLLSLLTTFHGRINRKPWWIAVVILIFASLSGTLLLNPEFFTSDELPPPNWPETIWQLILLIPITAITVKRFNDRDWPWWLGYGLSAFSFASYVLPHFGVLIAPHSGGAGTIFFWAYAAVGLFAFVDNGFIRGTDGPNRYGPDPLARSLQPT
jgi:uncharacterized membrane protein YhaH (DUF805 family)